MSKYWWIGDPLMKKQDFWKKSHNAEKTERGTLWDFSTSILSQNSKKNWRGGRPFEKKKFPEKKSRNAEKKLKGGPFGLVRYCMLRGKPFWFSPLGQRVQFGLLLKFCRTFWVELFWSLQVYRKKFKEIKKTLTKSHEYSRLFSQGKRRLKRTHAYSWKLYSCES